MHRGGTSVVTHILSKAGFFVGQAPDLIKGNQWNRDGYFERWPVYRINEFILNRCEGSWHAPPEEKDILKIKLDSQIESILNGYNGHKRSVIKDPRLCLTFPVWQRVLGDNLHIIHITRHPYATADSLLARDGFQRQKSLCLWKIYNERAGKYAKDYPTYVLKYEDLFSDDRRKVLTGLSTFLEIETDLEQIAARCVDTSLQHHTKDTTAIYPHDEKPIDPRQEYEIANLLVGIGRRKEAIAMLEKLLVSYPGHALAHNDLGVLYFASGKISGARTHIEYALRLSPDNAAFKNNLFKLNLEMPSTKKKAPAINKYSNLEKTTSTDPGKWWDYMRFRGEKVKVLLVSLRHLLLSEISGALNRLGHRCNVVMIAKEELGRGAVERMFTQAINTFHPDFVLTINHLGFDHEGVVTGLLSRYRVPFASWYVDSPHLIIRHHAENKSPYLTLFLWDKDYIEIVKKLGFENVEYLPLGVDEMLFRPMDPEKNPLARLASAVGFVGNSMVIKVRSKLSRCGIDGPLQERFMEVSTAFEHSHYLVVREMLKDLFPDLASQLAKLPEPQALGYETGVIWQATGQYRLARVRRLGSFKPSIVGDRGWKEILGNGFRLNRELNYYADLPAFYNVTKVNFNATSRQMKRGVNQRVFDVPACRGVIITDWTRQLEELMEPDREIIAYRDKEEIPEKVNCVLKDGMLHKNIANAGYRRALSQHTYSHRLERLVHVMKRNYG